MSEFKDKLRHTLKNFDWIPPWVWSQEFVRQIGPILEIEATLRDDPYSVALLAEIKNTKTVQEAITILKKFCEDLS